MAIRRSHALAVLAATLAGASAPGRAIAQSVPVKVAGPPTEDATNLYYALKNNFPARFGVDVDMLATSSGTAAVTGCIAGSYDLARTSLTAVFAAYLRDIPIVIVAPDNMHTSKAPFSLLQIAADSPYRTGADLNNKTVATPALNSFNELATKAWVDKAGGDWRSLKFVEIPNSILEAALQQHRVDAGILQPPQLDASLSAGTTKTLGDALTAISPNFLSGVYIARRDWVAQHTDALRRFNRLLNAASDYVNTHPVETAPLVAELTKVEPANVGKIRRVITATSIAPAMIQPVIDAAAKYGATPRAFPARDILWEG